MSHYSFFTCALASISFLAGGLVQAGDYLISNEEDYNTSIADTLESLSAAVVPCSAP